MSDARALERRVELLEHALVEHLSRGSGSQPRYGNRHAAGWPYFGAGQRLVRSVKARLSRP